MSPLPSSTSSAARTALIYVTVGALMVIWTGVWYMYLRNNEPHTQSPYYWCAGLLISGITLIGIGLGLGRLGSSARAADIIHSAVVTAPPPVDANGNPVAIVPQAPAPGQLTQAAPVTGAVPVPPPTANTTATGEMRQPPIGVTR
jgi:hypothetical protein